MTERPVAAPPVVKVLAILQYIGGGLVIVYALLGMGQSVGGVTGLLPPWGQLLYGAFYVGLARALQLGLRWARRVAVVLCLVGLAIAALSLLGTDPRTAIGGAVWPTTYLILLTRPSARDWFAPAPTPEPAAPES